MLVDARTFGLIGNGADDSGPLQAALNAVSSAGGILDLPPGTFRFAGPLAVPVSSVPAASLIRGAGRERTVLLNTANADGIISAAVGAIQQFVTIEDLTIDTTVTGAARTQGAGVHVTGAGKLGLSLNRVYVKNHFDGFLLSNVSVGRVQSCLAYGNRRDGFQVTGTGPSTMMTFANCYASSNLRRGYYLDSQVGGVLEGCTSEGNLGDEFYLFNTSQITFLSPYTELGAVGFSSLVIDTGNQTTIIGPRFDGSHTYGISYVGSGGANDVIVGGTVGGITAALNGAGALGPISVFGTKIGGVVIDPNKAIGLFAASGAPSVQRMIEATYTVTWGAIGASSTVESVQTLTGAAAGDIVLVTTSDNVPGVIYSARTTVNDQVVLRAANVTTGPVTPGTAAPFRVVVIKP